MTGLGKNIIVFGIIIVIAGIIIYFFGNKFSFLGKLPGDIKIEKENFKFYFPITTMLLLSLVINIVIKIIKHFTK